VQNPQPGDGKKMTAGPLQLFGKRGKKEAPITGVREGSRLSEGEKEMRVRKEKRGRKI